MCSFGNIRNPSPLNRIDLWSFVVAVGELSE
jgi:hypothetical protein